MNGSFIGGRKDILSEPIDWIGTVKVFHLGAFKNSFSCNLSGRVDSVVK